jgi:hypothetical protein
MINNQGNYGNERTNMGSMNTSGALRGRLGIVSNQRLQSMFLSKPL